MDDETTNYFFEFRIQFDEITKDVSLIETDFAEDEEEVEETGLADAVYALRESAMIAASMKFAEICEDYWQKGEDDPDSDEDDEEDEEDEEEEEEEHTGEAGDGYPKYTPMIRPSRYKNGNEFVWAGDWEHEDGHQMSSSVKVTVWALEVLP